MIKLDQQCRGVNEPEKIKKRCFGSYCALIVIFFNNMVEKGFKTCMNQNERKREKMFLIHSLIGAGNYGIFPFHSRILLEVTSIGMEVLGIFIGTLYLWTFVDPLWGA